MTLPPKLIGYETATAQFVGYVAVYREFIRSAENKSLEERLRLIMPLIVLNAAVLEGVFRSALTHRIVTDISALQSKMQRTHTGPEKIALSALERMRNDVELSGGWSSLGAQYKNYRNEPLSKLLDPPGKTALTPSLLTLMALRNVVAHGTAFIVPAGAVEPDDYGYDWQKKIENAAKYLESTFKSGSFYENLGHPTLPDHFLEKTREAFNMLETAMSPLSISNKSTIELVRQYMGGPLL